jgi:hypothetical protein
MFTNFFGKSFIAPLAVLLTFNCALAVIFWSNGFEGSFSWSGVGIGIERTFGSIQSFGLFLVAVLVLAVLALITLWLRRWAVALIIWAIVLVIVGAFFGSSLTKTFSFILNFGPILVFVAVTVIEAVVIKSLINKSRV